MPAGYDATARRQSGSPGCCAWGATVRRSGFTLIELVMTLALLGILAAVVGPKVFSTNTFDARGFHDETLALLRFAHKSAIAQRRPVCVTFTVTSARLGIDADRNQATGASGCEANLTGPRGDSPGSITARGSVQYAALPAVIVIDGLGQPAAGQTIQVVGVGKQVTVEPTTGFVHD